MHIVEILFPAKCPICGMILKRQEKRICHSCKRVLPRICEPMCSRCGKPMDDRDMESEYCFDCKRKQINQDVLTKGTALWLYDKRMKKAMADFKYGGCSENAHFFADELYRFRGEQMRKWQAEAIIPVPLHWRKKWFRGYNQAASLASALGARMSIPVYTDILKRKRYTKPQKGLSDRERRCNLQKAFCINQSIQVNERNLRRVLLVDDIYTTGATLESCATVLRTVGVEEIYFACLCIGGGY